VLSFPVFAVTFSLAQGVTVLLFGERYGTSAPILALLSLGYYVNAALGQNSLTLRVFGMVRYLVVSNLLAAAANVALLILLVPPLGALGAAVATSASLIFQNMVNQFGLGRKTPVHAFSRERAGVYVITAIAALGLLAIHLTRLFPMYVDLLLAGLASLGVLRLTRGSLDLPGTFPELLRLPLARRLFG
jgi:O-antigen/teichoic acid export membrane protein